MPKAPLRLLLRAISPLGLTLALAAPLRAEAPPSPDDLERAFFATFQTPGPLLSAGDVEPARRILAAAAAAQAGDDLAARRLAGRLEVASADSARP